MTSTTQKRQSATSLLPGAAITHTKYDINKLGLSRATT